MALSIQAKKKFSGSLLSTSPCPLSPLSPLTPLSPLSPLDESSPTSSRSPTPDICAGLEDLPEKEPLPVMVEFDLGKVGNDKLGTFDLKGSILRICIPELSPKPDMTNLEQAELDLTQWAVDMGLLQADSKYIKKFHGNFASIIAHMVPNLKVSDERMKTITSFYATLFILDDIIDNFHDHAASSQVQYHQVSDVITVLMDILSGKYTEQSQLPEIRFPLYKAFCKALLSFQKGSISNIPEYLDNNQYFVESMIDNLEGVLWEQSDLKHKTKTLLSENSYLFRRRFTIGSDAGFEYFALMHGISLEKKIRSNVIFKRFREIGSNCFALVNDIFSLRKEIQHNETENLILHKTQLHKMTIEESFDQCLKLLNSEIQDLILLADQLIRIFPMNTNLHKYISIVENTIDGHLLSYTVSKRYGDIKFNIKTFESELPYRTDSFIDLDQIPSKGFFQRSLLDSFLRDASPESPGLHGIL